MTGFIWLAAVGIAAAGIATVRLGHGQTTPPSTAPAALPVAPAPEGAQELVLGGGCFWCLEPLFEMLKGVSSVEVGYAGGNRPNLTYQEIGRGDTGAAEVLKLTYDPKVITQEDLLRIFFTIHDPTTLNRQGNDVGPQYRSVVFFADEATKATAERVIKEITDLKVWPNPIVTTLEPLKNYARAEEYHQDYYRKWETASPEERALMNNGYCRVIIDPKVREFQRKFSERLRKD